MKNYIVTAPFIQINAGAIVSLNDDQVKKRSFALREAKKGNYEVINPFHLKMGESFGSKDLIDKKFAHAIVEESEFKEKPVAEQIKDFNRPLLKKYIAENCEAFKADWSKTNEKIKADIVEFMGGEVVEIEAEETKEKEPAKGKPGRKKAPVN